MWAFALFFAFVLAALAILSVWIGPAPESWEPRDEDRLVTEEWLSRQRVESVARLHQTDAPGLVHTDDLAP